MPTRDTFSALEGLAPSLGYRRVGHSRDLYCVEGGLLPPVIKPRKKQAGGYGASGFSFAVLPDPRKKERAGILLVDEVYYSCSIELFGKSS